MRRIPEPSAEELRRAHNRERRKVRAMYEEWRMARARHKASLDYDIRLDALSRARKNMLSKRQNVLESIEELRKGETREEYDKRRASFERLLDHPIEEVRERGRNALDNFPSYDESIASRRAKLESHEEELNGVEARLREIDEKESEVHAQLDADAKKIAPNMPIDRKMVEHEHINNFPLHLSRHRKPARGKGSRTPHRRSLGENTPHSDLFLDQRPIDFGQALRQARTSCGIDDALVEKINHPDTRWKLSDEEHRKLWNAFVYMRALGYDGVELHE